MMINTNNNRANLYTELESLDLIDRLRPLLGKGGYVIRPEDGKFVPLKVQVEYNTPWVYINMDPAAKCELYHRVFFDVLGHVHSYCRNCWKVVVRPKTLEQLFDLYEVQRGMGVACKCGIERRPTVGGLYGAYFYNRGKEQGLERWQQVRDLVDKHLGPKVPVILKRYCTEFELGPKAKGPSDKMPDITEKEKEWEWFVESHFPDVIVNTAQVKIVVANTMRRWIRHAFKNGDQTYRLFTGGQPMAGKYVTYHPEEQYARPSDK